MSVLTSNLRIVSLFICGVQIYGAAFAAPTTEYGYFRNEQNTEADSDFESSNETSEYIVIDDMIINNSSTRAGQRDASWPNRVVPYIFHRSISGSQKQSITQAMNTIARNTCIRFRPMHIIFDPYSVQFTNGGPKSGCYATVGFQGRRYQNINISDGCNLGNIMHEIIHALGFYHEHTRNDRDNYVIVHYNRVQEGMESNFRKDEEAVPNTQVSYYGVPYNYDSIMHYGFDFFSVDGSNTIDIRVPYAGTRPLGYPGNIGQRDGLSSGDIIMLRRKYNCESGENMDEPVEDKDVGNF